MAHARRVRGKSRVRAPVRQEPRSALAARSRARGPGCRARRRRRRVVFLGEWPARAAPRGRPVRCLRRLGASLAVRRFLRIDARAPRPRGRGVRPGRAHLVGPGAARRVRRAPREADESRDTHAAHHARVSAVADGGTAVCSTRRGSCAALRAQFEVREIARQDILPHEARLRAKGLTELFEVCYQLVRL